MPAVVPGEPLPKAAIAAAKNPRHEPDSGPLWRFWAPRWWPTWLFLGWLRLAAALPWRLTVAIHEQVGHLLWRLMAHRRRVVIRNLEICFPELDAAAIRDLAKRHFQSVAVSVAEIALGWFGSASRMAPLFRIEGVEHLHAALKRGKGVLLFSGHFTTLEICSPVVKSLVPLFAFMFTRRRNPLLNAMQTRGRRRAAHVSMPNDDVRTLLRQLANNAVIWYAPDQAHAGARAELVPFFGEPAMTSTATSRIANVSAAAIVPFFFCRLRDRSGYVLRFHPEIEGIPSADARDDTARLMRVVEAFVRECPEQYLWIHRKFRGRPTELPDAYREPVAALDRSAPARAAATKARPRLRDVLAAPLAIVLVAAFIVLLDNDALWSTTLRATTLDEHQAAILWSMFAILFCTLVIGLALAPGRWTLKILGALALMVSAVSGHFMSEYGIVIDASMIRNVAETESQEAAPLLSGMFISHIALFGALPALLLLAMPLPKVPWLRGLGARSLLVFASAVTLVVTLYANYGAVSFFARDNDSVRFFFNPAYPIYSLIRYAARTDDRPPPLREAPPASVGAAHAARSKHTLLVFVVGETARADRFSFNGYARDTNRYTRPRGVVSYGNVTSCGTSTADSVPCVFSGLGREHFSHTAAATRENLFGTLQRLGAGVFWRDNSTGCKDVCDPEHFTEYATDDDPEFCDATGCFDEILLTDAESLVADRARDHFIVLHQRGSHGPAYHTDTPAWSKEFVPECDLPNLRNCDREAINNAYDNTILYSDYFLSRVIDFLELQSTDYDVALLYVSDHGESLGENGLYLHGFPYLLAPPEQTRVPMLFWAAPSFYASNGLDAQCIRASSGRDVSHDWIYHTLLPLFGVATPSYDASLDLFATCRGGASSAHRKPNESPPG